MVQLTSPYRASLVRRFSTLSLAASLAGSASATQLTPDQEEILSHQSIVYVDNGQGGFVKTLRITGINVQIVSGRGATNGYVPNPDSVDIALTTTDGTGNLIVGYNELGNPDGDDRTGSHNIVVGHGNSFSSFGGFVGPRDNTVGGPFCIRERRVEEPGCRLRVVDRRRELQQHLRRERGSHGRNVQHRTRRRVLRSRRATLPSER